MNGNAGWKNNSDMIEDSDKRQLKRENTSEGMNKDCHA